MSPEAADLYRRTTSGEVRSFMNIAEKLRRAGMLTEADDLVERNYESDRSMEGM